MAGELLETCGESIPGERPDRIGLDLPPNPAVVVGSTVMIMGTVSETCAWRGTSSGKRVGVRCIPVAQYAEGGDGGADHELDAEKGRRGRLSRILPKGKISTKICTTGGEVRAGPDAVRG